MQKEKTIIVRIPISTIEKLKQKYPELKNQKYAVIVRIALQKLLGE